MYEMHLLEDIAERANEAAVQACWTQWSAIGSFASSAGSSDANSMIDPEALVVLSLCIVEKERRLGDFLLWWSQAGAVLTSVQRLRAVSDRFPEPSGRDAFRAFARLATDAGDARWKGHAAPSASFSPRNSKGPRELALTHPSTLWLRLRAGFGVGAKSDALAFLLGLGGARATVKEISTATGYSDVSIRRAVGEMTIAGLLRQTGGRPTEYSAPTEAWTAVLGMPSRRESSEMEQQLPPWRYWAEIFAYLTYVAEWSALRDSVVPIGPRVLASRARDILDQFQRSFALNGMHVPDPAVSRGPEVVECLAETTAAVADWMSRHI